MVSWASASSFLRAPRLSKMAVPTQVVTPRVCDLLRSPSSLSFHTEVHMRRLDGAILNPPELIFFHSKSRLSHKSVLDDCWPTVGDAAPRH